MVIPKLRFNREGSVRTVVGAINATKGRIDAVVLEILEGKMVIVVVMIGNAPNATIITSLGGIPAIVALPSARRMPQLEAAEDTSAVTIVVEIAEVVEDTNAVTMVAEIAEVVEDTNAVTMVAEIVEVAVVAVTSAAANEKVVEVAEVETDGEKLVIGEIVMEGQRETLAIIRKRRAQITLLRKKETIELKELGHNQSNIFRLVFHPS